MLKGTNRGKCSVDNSGEKDVRHINSETLFQCREDQQQWLSIKIARQVVMKIV
jgi:hypothetical protein